MSKEITTAIPGGMAQWYDRNTMPPRRERMMQVELMPVRHLVKAVQDESYPITREEAATLLAVNEIGVVVFLKSWTLKNADGTDRPIPTTADEVLDIEDRELYQALLEQSAVLVSQIAIDDFGVDAVEDTNSPIGDLDA